MATVRIIISLKRGILDAAGQAVQQGLQALGYGDVGDVRIGRHVELTVPEEMTAEEIDEMCERFLANPLIEEWRMEPEPAGSRKRETGNGPRGSTRTRDARGLH